MALLTYATVDQLEAWLQSAVPDNAPAMLRSASMDVRAATRCDYYDTDTTGLPTDAATLAAFANATCCQVAMWIAAGINPAGGIAAVIGSTGAVSSSGIGTGSIAYSTAAVTSVQNINALQDAVQTLCPEAVEILLEAGLCQNGPWVIG